MLNAQHVVTDRTEIAAEIERLVQASNEERLLLLAATPAFCEQVGWDRGARRVMHCHLLPDVDSELLIALIDADTNNLRVLSFYARPTEVEICHEVFRMLVEAHRDDSAGWNAIPRRKGPNEA